MVALSQEVSVVEGRTESMRRLVQGESGRLWKYIRGRVASNEDADDVMQDVLAQLAGMAGPVEVAAAWLYTVAKNRIIDRYRKKRLVTEEVREDDEGLALGIEGWLADERGNPEDDYLRGLLWSELEAALGELPGEQRQVFVWHELEGMSFKDMATATGEKVPTLISRKRYAVLFLRERLAELYDLLGR